MRLAQAFRALDVLFQFGFKLCLILASVLAERVLSDSRQVLINKPINVVFTGMHNAIEPEIQFWLIQLEHFAQKVGKFLSTLLGL